MTLSFDTANNKYKADAITELTESEAGLRFLLLRSLSRTEHLKSLAKACNIDISAQGNRELFPFLYNHPAVTMEQIKASIKEIFQAERVARASQEATLINELYKMREFYWGGLHQNSLEKTIVDNYVKKIQSYDELNMKIDNELFESMGGYVRCSWYNHWTSIIIEDIFKENVNVLPAVGLVKKIDFFIRDTPFDLKVTYLPEGYIKKYRKEKSSKPEITLLKQAARKRKLPIDREMSEADLLEHLWRVIADQPDEEARKLIQDLRNTRLQMVNEIIKNPINLIRWLYENQGERRFDSSNRLFLILVNEKNFFQSWQLKRNRTLLAQCIGDYLGSVSTTPGRPVDFRWDGKEFNARADVIVVRHSPANGQC